MRLMGVLDEDYWVAVGVAIGGAVFVIVTSWMGAKHRSEARKWKGIPLVPGGSWFLGHLSLLMERDIDKRIHSMNVEYADERTGMCYFYVLGSPVLSILRGTHTKEVLHASHTRKMPKLYMKHFLMVTGPKALTRLNGKEWKFYRSVVHRAFTPVALAQAQPEINNVCSLFTQSLVQQVLTSSSSNSSSDVPTVTPILPLMKIATLDIFGRTFLGIDFHGCTTLEYTKLGQTIDYFMDDMSRRVRILRPDSFFYSIPSKANRRHRQARLFVRQLLSKVIQEGRQDLQSSSSSHHNSGWHNKGNRLLMHILQADSTNKLSDVQVTDSNLSDMLMVLIIAGFDTSSIIMTYALYILAKCPEMEQECLAEANKALLDGSETFSPEQCPYIEAVVMETLRLYPSVPTNTRVLERPLTLEGHTFPAGTTVWIPIWGIQRDANNFPRPLECIPERWVKRNNEKAWVKREESDTDENSSIIPPANRSAFCAFSEGARTCSGRKLAVQEVVTLIAHLLKNLKFELTPGYEMHSLVNGPMQKPKDDLPMHIRIRQSC